jgi:hypothetical protein
MMLEHDDGLNATNEQRVAQLVARLGNAYGRWKLSPPFNLKTAAEGYLRQGLTPDEIVRILDEHMDRCRADYRGGAGESLFRVFQADVGRAIAQKRPVADRPPARRQAPPRRSVVSIANPGGAPPDVLVVGEGAPVPQAQAGPVVRPSGLAGYESSGEPIGIEDDGPEAA